ncbi:hypothetical protein BKM63_07265 [Flavobacterium johnsoniae]|uniref:Uncharacterized protein n=1 Tax=Flavobacterium johnsoniae TaxID=986 RepID=A0A1J7CSN4_FLAJO|nr:hypothetical protein BKM63_07265 [Flavobacterium johnsoniae]
MNFLVKRTFDFAQGDIHFHDNFAHDDIRFYHHFVRLSGVEAPLVLEMTNPTVPKPRDKTCRV